MLHRLGEQLGHVGVGVVRAALVVDIEVVDRRHPGAEVEVFQELVTGVVGQRDRAHRRLAVHGGHVGHDAGGLVADVQTQVPRGGAVLGGDRQAQEPRCLGGDRQIVAGGDDVDQSRLVGDHRVIARRAGQGQRERLAGHVHLDPVGTRLGLVDPHAQCRCGRIQFGNDDLGVAEVRGVGQAAAHQHQRAGHEVGDRVGRQGGQPVDHAVEELADALQRCRDRQRRCRHADRSVAGCRGPPRLGIGLGGGDLGDVTGCGGVVGPFGFAHRARIGDGRDVDDHLDGIDGIDGGVGGSRVAGVGDRQVEHRHRRGRGRLDGSIGADARLGGRHGRLSRGGAALLHAGGARRTVGARFACGGRRPRRSGAGG